MFQSALTKLFPSIFILFLSIQSPWQHLAEGVPNSEECQESLIPVLEWLNETLAEDENRKADAVLAYFNNAINITDYNKNRSVEIWTDNNKWIQKIAENASYYLSRNNDSLSVCGGQWKRMLEEYSSQRSLISDDKIKMLATLMSNMLYRYSTSVVKYNDAIYRLTPELTKIMSDSRDFKTLLWAWREWHDLAKVNKANFSLMVDLMNETATEHEISEGREVMNWMKLRLDEMKPLYDQLHAYVRARLVNLYSSQVNGTVYEKILNATGPIPAHLLGNMWAQEWHSLEGVLVPYPDAPESPNVTRALLKQNYTIHKMFETAENFFVSLGFQNMTDVFWKKSVLGRYPADSNIKLDCNPRAFDMVIKDDYRIKICTEINSVDFGTIHRLMGYTVYHMEYRKQPIVFRQAANPVFAEAVGDTITLSVMSPRHLKKIGLVGESNEENSGGAAEVESSEELPGDDKYKLKINTLMKTALSKIAFLPFAFAFESWRYGVFAGDITPDEYTSEWWELRKMHQGVVPPEKRDSDKFDPGAKWHIVVNSNYSRHFINFVGQFQFHEALCKAAGFDGELYDCDIYGSQEAGQKLRAMLSEGSSRPWSELMMELTGTDTFNATSIVNYFKPLHEWLIAENKKKNNPIGW